VSVVYPFERFQLQDHLASHDDVCPEAFVERHSAIFDGNGNLTLDSQPSPGEFACQDHLVHRFQQPGAKFAMYRHRGIHNDLPYLILSHLCVFARDFFSAIRAQSALFRFAAPELRKQLAGLGVILS